MRTIRPVGALLVGAMVALCPRAEALSENHWWSAFVSARGGIFYNRFYNQPVDVTNGLGSVAASLAYSHYTRSSVFTLSGWASSLFLSSFNFGNFSVTASGAKELSPKGRLRFGAGLSDGFNYQDLIINGIFFVDQGVFSSFATGGGSYDFTPSTRGTLDFTFTRFQFDLQQRVDGSEFVFSVPGDDQVLVPLVPVDLPFPTDTTENALDASQLAQSLLAAEGAVLTKFTTEIEHLRGSLSHRFTDRTNLDFQLGYRWLTYQRPSTVAGNDMYASVRANHTFNPRTGISGSYIFRRNLVVAPAVSSHTGFAQVYRQISVPLRIDGNFGVTYYPIPTTNGSGYELIGGGRLSGEWVRTAFSLSYQRRAQHSIGIGRYLTTDLANVGVSYLFGRRWSGAAYAGYRASRGTFEQDFAFTVLIAGVNVRRRITEHFSVGANYLFRHLERSVLDYDTHFLSVVLTYGKRWK